MLVFLFDPASRYANELNRLYLHGDSLACPEAEQARAINALWQEHKKSLAETDQAILEYLGLRGADNVFMANILISYVICGIIDKNRKGSSLWQ